MHNRTTKSIFISALETSAENLAIDLVTQLKTQQNEIPITAVGSTRLESHGVKLIANNGDMDIMGLTKVISKAWLIRRLFRTIERHLKIAKPNLVILIDSSGFNLRLAKTAKKCGCKVLYYVSPQIWASRFKRIYKIKRYVDHMAVLYPFEKTIYDTHNISSSYVGHPILSKINSILAVEAGTSNNDATSIALLPGSRKEEASRLLPVIIKTAALIRNQYPNTDFILPLAPQLDSSKIKQSIPDYVKIITKDHLQHIHGAHCAICTSGTATLELALLGIPHVIVYKTSRITWAIVSRLLKTPFVGLPNILSQQRIVPELLQNQATPQRIFQSIQPFINNSRYHSLVKNHLAKLYDEFNDENTTSNILDISTTLLYTSKAQ